MKKTGAFVLLIALASCNDVEKLDKRLYDSTEVTTPVTKMDQLNEIDRQSAQSDSANTARDTTHTNH